MNQPNNVQDASPEAVFLSIGGIGLEIRSHSANLLRAVANHYAAFSGQSADSVLITIHWK